MTPLELLYEHPSTPKLGMPSELARLYAGELGFPARHTYANFVSSLDGVVSLPGDAESGRIVSDANEADRFVMALLRAFADAVVIGASTFRHTRGAFWHSQGIYPKLAPAFAELRRELGLRPDPQLVIVTKSAAIDLEQPAAEAAWIATTTTARLPATTKVLAFDPERVPLDTLFDQLRAEGFQRLLTEGGPTLFGELVRLGLVDEMFLTTSPRLFGRSAGDGKKALVEGADLGGRALELRSLRRHGSHLFLRYGLL